MGDGGENGEKGVGGGGAAWEWRRPMLAWEEESVSECFVMLHDIIL